MAGATSGWASIVDRNSIARFVDINLRGAGQVIFQDNPLTGLLFLLAILWGAVAADHIAIAAGAIIALVVATTTAILLDVDRDSLRQGLFGFNGVLVGAAIPTFLATSPAMWVILIIAAAVSTVVMLAVSGVMKTWGVPALTFPFVLTTWFIVLSAYSFAHLHIAAMGPPSLPQPLSSSAGSSVVTLSALTSAWLKGPAQVFLINNAVSGAIVVLGLLASSAWAALFSLVGSAIALIIALAFGANFASIEQGLFGFSPVLTAVGLGCVFYKPSWRTALFMLLGTVFTVIVQGALDVAVAPLGIPTFTAPFVIATWLFLIPKASLQPHPHAPIEDGVINGKTTGTTRSAS